MRSNSTKRFFLLTFLVFVCGITYFQISKKYNDEKPYVNVYDWYGMLSKDIIKQFENETGIKVHYDIYDSNEMLEAKLLATNSGYDVVFPSASPYVARQIQMGVYLPLNKSYLPNLKNLNAEILHEMEAVDPGMVYAIPYYWGTLGLAFDKEKVLKYVPDAMDIGYKLIFDSENLKKLSQCRVSFLEESVDVFPLVLGYLEKDPNTEDLKDLDIAFHHLLKLRPYIHRFTSSRFMNDLVMGDVCVAQVWSGDVHQAMSTAKELGRDIVYVIPKEGTTLWLDCMAIPKGAPHPKNAHKFINFLLRPDISAKITNRTYIPTIVVDGYKMVDLEIRKNPTIFPPKELMRKLRLDKPRIGKVSHEFDRQRTRAWAHIRLAKVKDEK